jgi:hypothetical protein
METHGRLRELARFQHYKIVLDVQRLQPHSIRGKGISLFVMVISSKNNFIGESIWRALKNGLRRLF